MVAAGEVVVVDVVDVVDVVEEVDVVVDVAVDVVNPGLGAVVGGAGAATTEDRAGTLTRLDSPRTPLEHAPSTRAAARAEILRTVRS